MILVFFFCFFFNRIDVKFLPVFVFLFLYIFKLFDHYMKSIRKYLPVVVTCFTGALEDN